MEVKKRGRKRRTKWEMSSGQEISGRERLVDKIPQVTSL
jgi:hypothetical protein